MVYVNKVIGVRNAYNEVDRLIEFNKDKNGQYNFVYVKLLATGQYAIGLLKNKPINPNYYNKILPINRIKKDNVKDREKKIDRLIIRINKSALFKNEIKDVEFAKKLMMERLTNEQLNHSIWQFLSFDKKSGKHFKFIRTDPTLPIVFVDINYLRNRKGNPIIQKKENERIGKSVEKIKELLKSGVKLDNIPTFYIRESNIGEGNHRVEALYQLGYKSCPVYVSGAWD